MTHSFDVTVIGGGPGGYTAAIRAAQLGQTVGIIERDRLGGICLNWGCIPTKALLKNAELWHSLERASEFGFTIKGASFDFSAIINRSRGVADKLSKGVEFLMKKNKITFVKGTATFKNATTIEVKDEKGAVTTVTSKNTIIATGARARSIPGVAIDGKRTLTSTEAMILKEQPKTMTIIGAGAIGVEFAYFYNTFGTKVTIVEMLPNVLPIEDTEVSDALEKSFRKAGVDIRTKTKVKSVTPGKSDVKVVVETDGKEETLTSDVALIAIGVQGNTENLGLEALGVAMEKGFIKTDDHLRTNVKGIYAIGDVNGPPWLAHVASAEGVIAAETIAGKATHGMKYDNVPGCTYCQPQVASVGLTERAAREKGHELKIGKFPFAASGKSIAMGETSGFVKLIFDAKYGELLGAHIIGAEATELIAELGVARSLETTGEALIRTIHAHPTLSEAVMEAAANAYGEAINI